MARDGHHLYSDLHLNLQPLFVLLTRYSLTLFGTSWLGFRVFPALQVVLYTFGLMLVARYVPWRDRNRALLILAAFGMTMTIPYYRFDDFHVTTQIFQIYALWLLLVLDREPTPRRTLWISFAIGMLAGLSLGNRLNDGAALFAACAISIFGSACRHRTTATLLFCVTAIAAFGGVLLLTGDTLSSWFHYSVVLAAQIKSGSGHIWLYPLLLPFRTVWRFLKSPRSLSSLAYFVLIVVSVVLGPSLYRRLPQRRRVLAATGFTCFFLVLIGFFLKSVSLDGINPTVAAIAVPFTYVLFVVIVVRFVRHLLHREMTTTWHARELLLLVPMMQLFLAAITGGMGETETAPSIALTLLLLPIVTPVQFTARPRRALVLTAALVAIAAFPYKYLHPFLWHDYGSAAMFTHRAWYAHPFFGPVYVDRRQWEAIAPVCGSIQSDPGTGLLSMPYPHANYFCNVVPWRGYVQTWYDTSSRQTIDSLAQQLRAQPPTWIFYERSFSNMEAHEIIYNGGRPLAHRQLDDLLMQRIADGMWTVVHRQCIGGADWMLVRTSPPRPSETVDYPVIMTKRMNLCSRTRDD